MKKTFTFWKSLFLLFALIVGSGTMWADVITFDFEDNTAHRTSGNNSYSSNSYSENNVTISLSYADAVTTGTPINGSANVIGRVAKKTTNSPVVLIGPISISNRKITAVSYKTKGNSDITMTVEYSLDNSTWNSLESYLISSSTETKGKSNLNITGTNLYLRFTGSVSSADNNNRDFQLDDIVITHEENIVAITSIAFPDPKTSSVGVGGTTTLSPTVLPTGYTEAIDWESDATGVATVNSSGVVTGVAAGTAHITAKAHNNPTTIYDVCTITVTAAVPVTGVSLKSSTTLLLGGTETLVPTIVPNNATNQNVTWSSADGEKVSVDENGLITALALTNGTPVGITATTADGGFTATCEVTVNPVPVSGVTLKVTEGTLRVNKTIQLEATVAPDNATDKTLSWESDDTDKATVSSSGLVTAKAVGTATITAKSNADNTKTATFALTIVDGAISLNPGGSITFDDFSGAGNSYNSGNAKSTDFTADDEKPYEWSGNNYMSSNGLQLRASSNNGTITSPVVKAPYGYQLVITGGNVTVLIGNNEQTAVSTKTWELPNNTAFTLRNNTSNALTVTKVVITALKQPVATNLAITDPGTLAKDATGTFAYNTDTEAANTKAWTSSNSDVINITDEATGAYTAVGRGTAKITLTLTPTDATNYKEATATLDVTVNEQVTITVEDININIHPKDEQAIGATTTPGYSSTLTYASNNTEVAEVDNNGKVTAKTLGTATITITAPADDTNHFTGNTKDITVTVSEGPKYTVTFNVNGVETVVKEASYNAGITVPANPEAIGEYKFQGWSSTTVATTDTKPTLASLTAGNNYKPSDDEVYYAVYAKQTIVPDVEQTSTFTFKGSAVSSPYKNNEATWTFTSVAFGNQNYGLQSQSITLTPSANVTSVKEITIKKSNTWGQSVTLTMTDASSNQIFQIKNGNFTSSLYTKDITSNQSSSYTFTSSGNAWIEYITLTYLAPALAYADYRTSLPIVEITIPASGYLSYCSPHKLDFSETNVKAYKASVNAGTVTLTKVDVVPAEEGVVLFSSEIANSADPAATDYIIPVTEKDASDVSGNEMVGVLARTQVEWNPSDGVYNYILQQGEFRKATTPGGYLKPNRAYLSTSYKVTAVGGGDAKALTIVFNDATTGINGVEEIAPVTKTRKVVKNGRLVIETPNGEFTIDGAKVK